MSELNGAQSLIRTLVDAGVEVCFANPGTSEMHFVAALDTVPEMRGVLALFEGVVTGAADGYARIADKPAATLLRLGPGLGNGLAGLPTSERLGYLAEQVTYQLDGVKHLVVAGTKAPVSFFAYPGKPSDLVPEGAQVHTLASVGQDVTRALNEVADLVAADTEPVLQQPSRPALPSGPLTPQNWVDVIGAQLPENAIIADEASTSGLLLPTATAGAPRHDVLSLFGGAFGFGMPVATGAAVAGRVCF